MQESLNLPELCTNYHMNHAYYSYPLLCHVLG